MGKVALYKSVSKVRSVTIIYRKAVILVFLQFYPELCLPQLGFTNLVIKGKIYWCGLKTTQQTAVNFSSFNVRTKRLCMIISQYLLVAGLYGAALPIISQEIVKGAL